jgi:hemerythrin
MNTPTTTFDEQPTLTWSDDLVMNMDQMDQTHREFVDLLAALEAHFERNASDGKTAYLWVGARSAHLRA